MEDDRRQGERRRTKRVPVEMWVEETLEDALYFQRSANLSAGGLFFEQTIPHPIGTLVNLKFTLPGYDEPIETQGEIVGTPVEEGLGMAVKFIDLTEQQRESIERFVEATGA